MAEIFTDEGIDLILDNSFGNGGTPTLPATLYVGLFTSQTASTVPARTAVGGAVPSGWTEMVATSGTYARHAIATTDWGNITTNGDGRRRSAAQVDFTGLIGAAAANGFFIATASESGAGDKIVYFSNFDSGAARTFAALTDTLLVTPYVQLNG